MSDFLIKFFATGFGAGYIPKAPGTFATLFAAAIWWYLPGNIFFIIAFLFFLTAIIACGNAEKLFDTKDDQRIVMDEIIGYFSAIALLPKTYFTLISSIILFRFFDIKKPFFIKSVQKFNGSRGIIIDDLIAGIFTNTIIRVILLLWK